MTAPTLKKYQVDRLLKCGFTRRQAFLFAAVLGYANRTCERCGGEGASERWVGRWGGVCFQCGGGGVVVPVIHSSHMKWAEQGVDYAMAKADEKWIKLPIATGVEF